MITKRILKIGNSYGVILPAEYVKQLGLENGCKVTLKLIEGKIVITKVKENK